MDARKVAGAAIVDPPGDQLEALCHPIREHPGLAFDEGHACRWLSEFVGAHGLEVEGGVGGIATALGASDRAWRRTGGRDPPRARRATRDPPCLRARRDRGRGPGAAPGRRRGDDDGFDRTVLHQELPGVIRAGPA
jgi:hypothetical protein